jgi:hypothetical protein
MESSMKTVNMSANAVAARIRRVAELRRLCLSLGKAKRNSHDTTNDKQPAALNPPTDGFVISEKGPDPRKNK